MGQKIQKKTLDKIILRLEETTTDQRTFQKYLRQLRVLPKLRKLDIKFDNMIQNMAKYIDAENDYLYIRGKQEEQSIVVENLLTQTGFGISKIAAIANVTIAFVKQIKQKLSVKNN